MSVGYDPLDSLKFINKQKSVATIICCVRCHEYGERFIVHIYRVWICLSDRSFYLLTRARKLPCLRCRAMGRAMVDGREKALKASERVLCNLDCEKAIGVSIFGQPNEHIRTHLVRYIAPKLDSRTRHSPYIHTYT